LYQLILILTKQKKESQISGFSVLDSGFKEYNRLPHVTIKLVMLLYRNDASI